MTRLRRGVAAAAVLPLALTGCLQEGSTSTVTIIETTATGTPLPAPTTAPSSTAPTEEPTETEEPEESGPPELVGTIATGLAVPWGIAFLPNGDALVTERDSTRVLLLRGPEHEVVEVATVGAAAPAGEGGLLGVAVSPSYDDDGLVYLYVTTPSDNRVVRGVLDGERLGELEPVLTGIPNGVIHDGGQLGFGPDENGATDNGAGAEEDDETAGS